MTKHFDDAISEVEGLTSPHVHGEESVSGSAPEITSDDNALDAAQRAGLYGDGDEENPVEVGIGEQINRAERARRGLDTKEGEETQ